MVSDAGGMKEIVRDRVDGVVFPKEDHRMLAGVIRQLYHDRKLLGQFGASAGQRVAAMCSPEQMRDRVLQMYDKCLENRGQAAA